MHGAWPKWEPFDFVACIIVVGGLVAFHFYEVGPGWFLCFNASRSPLWLVVRNPAL